MAYVPVVKIASPSLWRATDLPNSGLPSTRKVVWVSKNPQVTMVRKGAFRRCAAVFLQLGRAPSSCGSVPYNSPTSVFECRVHFCSGHLLAVGVR
jgi:hypothetical protein